MRRLCMGRLVHCERPARESVSQCAPTTSCPPRSNALNLICPMDSSCTPGVEGFGYVCQWALHTSSLWDIYCDRWTRARDGSRRGGAVVDHVRLRHVGGWFARRRRWFAAVVALGASHHRQRTGARVKNYSNRQG